MATKLKTLFLGTPALAVPYLELCREMTDLQAVMTTPDEPSGRGYEIKPTPVKEAALHRHLPVYQPAKLKDPEFLAQMRQAAPELGIIVAYGKLLPRDFLALAKIGFLNVHFSLLPAYRGAAPLQRALMNGEKVTGVTLFWLDEGMDTGPMFVKRSVSIDDPDDAVTLREKLVPAGLDALREALTRIGNGDIVREPQTGPSSLAPMIKKEEGKIDWQKPSREIFNQIRGLVPSPGAFTGFLHEGKPLRLKILKALPLAQFGGAADTSAGGVAGLERDRGFVVKCARDFLQILQVQPEGRKPMSAWSFWQGARLKIGDKLE